LSSKVYSEAGYKVVRIPYFIQLSKKAVITMFGIDISFELFDENIPSLGVKGENTPAYLCPAGLKRMAMEFHLFPEQYKTNLDALKKQNDLVKTGVEFLESEYNK
jgi:hypothetical protein